MGLACPGRGGPGPGSVGPGCGWLWLGMHEHAALGQDSKNVGGGFLSYPILSFPQLPCVSPITNENLTAFRETPDLTHETPKPQNTLRNNQGKNQRKDQGKNQGKNQRKNQGNNERKSQGEESKEESREEAMWRTIFLLSLFATPLSQPLFEGWKLAAIFLVVKRPDSREFGEAEPPNSQGGLGV